MTFKRLLNVFLVWCMLTSLVSFGWVPNQVVPDVLQTGEAQAAAPTVNIGDYLQFGKYNDAPILWRVIHKDANGDPVLLADRILTLKAFDAGGSYHSTNSLREMGGSNYYPDSNIRQWLNSNSTNSGATTIDWIQNDPSVANFASGSNPYNTEKGFLADGNFTSTERGVIKPLTQKVLLHSLDTANKDGGSANHIYDGSLSTVVQNYDTTAYYKNVTDKVFLLSVKQLKEYVYDNRSILGTDYHKAKPTAEAVSQSTYKDETNLNSTTNRFYWLNSPYAASSLGVLAVHADGYIYSRAAYDDLSGVRPALQLDLASASFSSGAGTSGDPFVVTASANEAAPVSPSNATLAAGGWFNLAINTDGNVVAWGNNDHGQLNIPAGLTDVKSVAGGVGNGAAFAVKHDGTVVGWGHNGYGQLNIPDGLTNVVSVSAGGGHVLALKSDGTVVAWGLNNDGEANVPAGLTDVVAISAGIYHNLALKSDGTVVAWGSNYFGSTWVGQSSVPAGLTDVIAISAGGWHSLALKRDGTVVAWGKNDAGETNVPADLTNVKAIAAGAFHNAALKSDGTVVGWGYNEYGQTVPPVGLTNVVSITAGDFFSAALKSDGTVVGWGISWYGVIDTPSGLVVKLPSSNQAPTDISLSESSIAENSPSGSTIGTLGATDADAGDTATFTLVSGTGDTDNASFTINGTSLNTAASFDYETKSSYSILVQVADSAGATYKKQLTITVTDVNEAVTGVSVDKSAVSLTIGGTSTATIAANVAPATATNKNVTWSSSNTAVATVSTGGLITAVGNGTATITVTTADGNKTAKTTVTVTTAVSSVSVNQTSVSLSIGGTATATIVATVAPATATNKNVTWSSSNTAVATVSTGGLITAKANGTATITVTTVDGSKTATVAVTVTTAVTGVSVSMKGVSLIVGGTATASIVATVAPATATNKNVTWSSSNTAVASVSTSGVITAAGNGTATITVTTADGSRTATVAVIVTTATSGVSVDKSAVSLIIGGTATATATVVATVTPATATNKNVTWSSSNTKIATVSTSGVITAVANGTATITVTTADGSRTATVAVTVTTAVSGVSVNQTSVSLIIGGTSTATIVATVAPAMATNKNVTWSSSNTAVALVNNSGVITAVGNGTATITVTTADGSRTATVAVTVTTTVTGISVDKSAVSLIIGGTSTATIVATVTPATATNKNFTWSSSNVKIATVSSSGLITAVANGTATITVTTADGSRTATVAVIVTTPVVKVSVDKPTVSVIVGGTATASIVATVAPATATFKNVTWSSSNTAVATVNNSGVITAVGNGTATITVTTVDGSKTATVAVTVTTAVTGVSVDKSAVNVIIGGTSTATIAATVAPATATNKNVTWSSSNAKIATVSNSGVITAVANGTATITVTTADGSRTATVAVTVTTAVSGVSVNQTSVSLIIGGTSTATIAATVAPATATNKAVTWSSSNTAVATVNNSGLITLVGNGTATITVTTVDGSRTATVAVTVTTPVSGVSVDQSAVSLSIDETSTASIVATVAPATATNKNVTWSSSNTAVATVSTSGVITAVGSGTATITVTTAEGSKTATVAVAVSGVIVDKSTVSLIIGGKSTAVIAATLIPSTASNKAVTWSSSNIKVATVSNDNYNLFNTAVITAVGNGTATITVTTADGRKTATIAVAVTTAVTDVSVDKSVVSVNTSEISTEKITATVTPATATNQNVTWSSSNIAVATVSNSGLITAVGSGTATITVTTADGKKTAKIKVDSIGPISSKPSSYKKVKIGQYIQFGKYDNNPILWRVINVDPETGDPILFANDIVALKAFDAAGSYHIGKALTQGSNYYKDSNIRQWLNSSSMNSGADTIDWIQNDPIKENLLSDRPWIDNFNKPYAREKGFLADGNFTATERGLINPLTHKVLLHDAYESKKDGGTENHSYDRGMETIETIVQNYDTTAYYQNVTDSIFLLSVKQLKEWVFDNSATLGANYHKAQRSYWLNTPMAGSNSAVRYVFYTGIVDAGYAYDICANYDVCGVRPALQLDLDGAIFASGSGTNKSPFVLTKDNVAPTKTSLSNSSIDENSASGTTVGTLSAKDSAGDTATFTLVSGPDSTDNGSFTIVGTSLKSAINTNFDFETKPIYSIRVRVTDGKGVTYEKPLTIIVSDVNETSTSIKLSDSKISENNTVNAVVGTFSNNDPDADSTFTYTLVAGTGDIDNARFTISGTKLQANEVFDDATKSSYSIRVRVTDDGGLTNEQVFMISVIDILTNLAPTDIALSTSSMVENIEVGSTVGTFSATDVNIGDTATYTLVSGTGDLDNAIFTIVGTSLQTIDNIDYELKSSYNIRVRVTDRAGATYEEAITIAVTNVIEAPTDIVLSTFSIDENRIVGSTVGTLIASDDDEGDTATFTLVSGTGDTNNASFTIDGTSLKTTASFDYETKSSYSIRVRVTDGRGATYEEVLTIRVTNLFEFSISSNILAANASVGTTVGILSVPLSEEGGTPYFTLISGTGDTDNSRFSIEGSVLKTAGDYFYKPDYSIRVQIVDRVGLESEEVITIKSTQLNTQLTTKLGVKAYVAMEIMLGHNIKNASNGWGRDAELNNAISINNNPYAENPTYVPCNSNASNLIIMDFGVKQRIALRGCVLTGEFLRVKVNAGALTDEFGNLNVEWVSDIFAGLEKIKPTIKDTFINPNNQELRIEFSETVKLSSEKDFSKIQLSTGLTNGLPTFKALPTGTKVISANNQVVITLPSKLSGPNNRIRVLDGAVLDAAGNSNDLADSKDLLAKETIPTITKVRMNQYNDELDVYFNSKVTKKAGILMYSKLQLATDGVTFHNLKTKGDQNPPVNAILWRNISVNGNILTIKLVNELVGTSNRLKILAGMVDSVSGHSNAELISSEIALDKEGDGFKPFIKDIEIARKNTVINVTFNERIDAVDVAALKSRIKLDRGDSNGPFALTNNDEVIVFPKHNLLRIILQSKLFTDRNQLIIEADTVKDYGNNTNDRLVSSVFTRDKDGPSIEDMKYNEKTKKLRLTFDEVIRPGQRALKNCTTTKYTTKGKGGVPTVIEKTTCETLKTQLELVEEGIRLSTGGKTLQTLGPNDYVQIDGKDLIIYYHQGLNSEDENRILINAGVLKDLVGNRNKQLISDWIDVDW